MGEPTVQLVSITTPLKRGRPRTHASQAEKQKEYRKRKKENSPPRIQSLATEEQIAEAIHQWNIYLAKNNLSADRGKFMEEADAGCGLLMTGGNDPENLDWIDARQQLVKETGGGGRRTKTMYRNSPDMTSPHAENPEYILQKEIEALEEEEALRKSKLNDAKPK